MTNESEKYPAFEKLKRMSANSSYYDGIISEMNQLLQENERLRSALEPFAEPHAMGDNYVKFSVHLIESARQALNKQNNGSV